MRSILAVVALSASTTVAVAEETYLLTGQAFGACVGTQMSFKFNPPELIAQVLKEKCGKLEAQEREQFSDFLTAHVGETFTAELAFTIIAHDLASLQKLREDAVEAYVKAMKQAPRPTPRLQPLQPSK
jgi:hypothetical protein